jgi:hypothetical protein
MQLAGLVEQPCRNLVPVCGRPALAREPGDEEAAAAQRHDRSPFPLPKRCSAVSVPSGSILASLDPRTSWPTQTRPPAAAGAMLSMESHPPSS